MNFLFWNTKNRQVGEDIVRLFVSREIDVAVFAEYGSDDRFILSKLFEHDIRGFFLPNIACDRIRILTRRNLSEFSIKSESDRFTFREFRSTGSISTLLCMVHFPSKLYMNDGDQKAEACYLRSDIEKCEAVVGHSNTIVFGDFNMNPFDGGMFFADALHSVPCKIIASKGCRVVGGREHKYFYNPSWNLLGDRNCVPGTYYLGTGSYSRMHWNVLDQVILRPEMAGRFISDSLSTVSEADGYSLIGRDNKPSASDHMPIVFSFNLRV